MSKNRDLDHRDIKQRKFHSNSLQNESTRTLFTYLQSIKHNSVLLLLYGKCPST